MHGIISDPEAIQRFVREAVTDAIREELPALVRAATQKPFLTKEEVMDLTGWSERKLQNLRDTRQIPFVQHGRKILYPTQGLEEFLNAHCVRTRDQQRVAP